MPPPNAAGPATARTVNRPQDSNRPWQAIDETDTSEALRHRQAARVAHWCQIGLPAARVVAELAYPAGRAA